VVLQLLGLSRSQLERPGFPTTRAAGEDSDIDRFLPYDASTLVYGECRKPSRPCCGARGTWGNKAIWTPLLAAFCARLHRFNLCFFLLLKGIEVAGITLQAAG
jgi:hypothetical protein